MLRQLLLLVAGACVAGSAWAEEQVPQPVQMTCGQELGSRDFVPVEAGSMSRERRAVMDDLFDQLAGEWSGSMEEQVCMLNGSIRRYEAASSLAISAGASRLKLSGEDRRSGSKSRKLNRRSLFITREGLRVDNRSRAGDVELLGVSDSALALLRRYRLVHRPSSVAPQTGAALVAQQLQAGLPWGAASQSQDEDAEQDAAPEEADSQAAKHHSQTREERYYLQLSGSNALTITQQYFQQGRFIGSNLWRLRRD